MIDFSDLYVGENKSSNKNKSSSPIFTKKEWFMVAAVSIGTVLWYGNNFIKEAYKHDAEQMTKEKKISPADTLEENPKSEAYQLKR